MHIKLKNPDCIKVYLCQVHYAFYNYSFNESEPESREWEMGHDGERVQSCRYTVTKLWRAFLQLQHRACYSLDLEYPPEAHELKTWYLG
jgi:hypothetical protein